MPENKRSKGELCLYLSVYISFFNTTDRTDHTDVSLLIKSVPVQIVKLKSIFLLSLHQQDLSPSTALQILPPFLLVAINILSHLTYLFPPSPSPSPKITRLGTSKRAPPLALRRGRS